MSGYLNFLQSLTDSQQRHEIQRLVASQSQGSIAEAMLKHPTVVEFNNSLGFQACWKIRAMEFGTEAGEIGSPRFSEDFCIAPIFFRYENLTHYYGWTTSNLEYQLVVNAFVYIDDYGEPMLGTVTCSSNQGEVDAEKRILNDLQKHGYVDYLRALTPLKRSDAICDLAKHTWETEDSKFLSHPQLAAALRQSSIADLIYSETECGPVELQEDRCTAPITYKLYGFFPKEENENSEAKYYVEVHILACISDRAPSGSADVAGGLSVEDMSFSIIPIEDHETTNLMIVS
jgi:hypothetical protein